LRFLALFVALLSACTDPALNIQFDIPGRYRSAIVNANLRVLEPPVLEPFDCEALAFSRIAPDVIRLSTVLEVRARASENVPLAELDRLSTKLLVADGLDDDGETLVTGCYGVGEVDGVLEATVIGEPIAIVSAPTNTATAPPGALTAPVVFEIKDRLGQQLADIDAQWKVTGGGGMGDSGDAISGSDGRLRIEPRAPSRAGPFLLSVRVRWGTPTPAIVPGAVTPSKDVEMLPGRAVMYRSGNVGPTGQAGLAILVDTGVSRHVVVFYREGTQYMRTTSAPVSADAILGVLEEIREPTTTGRDRIIAIDGNDWMEIRPDGSIDRKALVTPGFGLPINIVSATECRTGSPPRVVVGFDDGQLAAYGADGAVLDGHFANRLGAGLSLEVLASGCVDVEQTGPVRTYVLSPGSLPLILIGERSLSDIAIGNWIALTSAIGFAPFTKSNVGLLLGTQIDGNDFVLARARARITGMVPNLRFELIDEGTDRVPDDLSPLVTTAGSLDAVNRLDVVSLFGSSSDGRVIDGFQIWSFLGLEESGRRISGPLVNALPQMTNPDLHLLDIDRDGTTDLLVGDRPTSASTTRIEIYRLGGS